MSAIRRVAVPAALVVGVLVGSAPAASAHAVLLRTDPSPQTTVPESPSAIRLEFSEPVEVAFGAVRLFDVDGRRVDAGPIRRAQRNREILLPVPTLDDGSYTVTWRVASVDGHPVSGGFEFYVGAPSSISAVPVEATQEAGTAMRWSFGAVRFVWFASLMLLVGMVAARRWVWTPGLRAAGLGRSPAASAFRRRFRAGLPAAWAVLVIAGLLWLVFQAASLSGLSLLSSSRPSVMGEILRTSFGRFWAVGLALTVVALLPVTALVRRRPLAGVGPSAWIALLGVLVSGICLMSALSGHVRTDADPGLTVPSVAAHLLAAAVWVGGLAALVGLGGPAWRSLPGDDRRTLLAAVVPRFSRLAIGALALVLLTGVVNSLASLGPVSDLWRVAYGRVLSAKIVLLGVALALAARHLLVVPRRLVATQGGAADATSASFQRSATAELGVLGVVVALAAALVTLVPGRTLAEAAKGPVNQEQPVGDYTAQLFIDPSTVGDNELHVTFVDRRGVGAAEVSNAEVSLGPVGAPSQPVQMRLISPGHFVGDATLPVPGRYRMTVRAGGVPSSPSTTFNFRLDDDGRAR